MKRKSANTNSPKCFWTACTILWACIIAFGGFSAQTSAASTVAHATAPSSTQAKLFETPQQAADALVSAAGKFDVDALIEIFGPDGNDIVFSGEFPQDRKHAADFAAEAREKMSISMDPKRQTRAFLL